MLLLINNALLIIDIFCPSLLSHSYLFLLQVQNDYFLYTSHIVLYRNVAIFFVQSFVYVEQFNFRFIIETVIMMLCASYTHIRSHQP